MKTIIQHGFTVRRRLIRDGKSHLPAAWCLQKMAQVEYWLATAPVMQVVKNHKDLITILLPNNFIPKFNSKYQKYEQAF